MTSQSDLSSPFPRRERPPTPPAEESVTAVESGKPGGPLLLRPLLKLPGMISLTIKRQRHHLGLTLLALLGIILAVGLITNASFFSQAVDRVILTQELRDFSSVTGRPPFSTRVYTFPSARRPITLQSAERASVSVGQTLSAEVGLPLKHQGMEISSGSMMLQPGPQSTLYAEGKTYLGDVNLVYIEDIDQHIDIVEGEPLDPDGVSGDILDVWMHDRLVQEMGVQVGEIFQIGVTLAEDPTPVRLAGFWQASDPEEDFWFNNPDTTLDDSLLVRRQDYINTIQPLIPSGTRQVNWHIILDDSKLLPKDSPAYLAGFDRALAIINKYLPEARLNAPPLDPLETFVDRGQTLTILLLGFNLPAFFILLYFLILTSVIIAQWQRRETSILVSRGMSVSGILNMTLLEQLLLFIIGYPLGVALGMLIARLMGYTASFLTFTQREPLPVSLQGLSLPLTILALAIALLARLWPAAQAAKQSIVTEERERARPSQGPFWYRFYLDFLLLLPTYYAYRQLTDRGSLAALVSDRPEDLYRDPLLILVPALFVLTAALMTMRIFPFIMRLIDLLAGLTPWLTPHLALRQLGRQSQDYINPLLLVIVSLALGVYTLSMAASLDQWLIDRMFYRVGADLRFTPQPLSEDAEYIDGDWIPTSDEFRNLDGVAAATRAANFSTRIRLTTDSRMRGRFMAVDRLTFPSVAWFRFDFAGEPLGALMNRLAVAEDGILVSQDFLLDNNLRVGDKVPLLISINTDYGVDTSFTIVGVYNYFPTVYESEEITIIGNLDYLSSYLGFTVPFDVWLRLKPGADGEKILDAVPAALSIKTSVERDAGAVIAEEQAKMERVGIFGTLSIGFLAATVMAALGLLIYSYASLQERIYRFAILHAVGLSRGQIMAQVIMEYTFLAIYGALAGSMIGALASQLFVPFFRVSGEGGKGMPLPPLLPIIAKQEVGNLTIIFATSIVLIEVIIIASALYQRLVTMLKGHWS